MACSIEGVEGQQWIAPEWMARNAVFFLIPHVQTRPGGLEIAGRLRTIIDERAPRVILGDLLALPDVAMGWVDAVLRAEEAIAAEDPQAWNDPACYEPFRLVFKGLRLLPVAPPVRGADASSASVGAP